MTWLTQITMGSLFDGIGGFPLAAVRNGITPVWASEIEAFPIEVTKLRFPGMIHVGDITKLNGAELPPVDIICGGSPCQDLSVAGTRAGLAGARSGLFMEQMRIVREMRLAEKARGRESVNIRPRWMCWENVPGAFSSGTPKYEDFRIVLEEIVRICFPNELIPGPYPYASNPSIVICPMSVISRQEMCFLLRGAVWTRNCVASRSVASAFFCLLTLPGRLRPSFYLMYLTKRKIAGRSHRCTDSTQTGR